MPENGTFLNNTVGKITIFINCFWTEPNRANVLLGIDKILFSLLRENFAMILGLQREEK